MNFVSDCEAAKLGALTCWSAAVRIEHGNKTYARTARASLASLTLEHTTAVARSGSDDAQRDWVADRKNAKTKYTRANVGLERLKRKSKRRAGITFEHSSV